MPEATRPTFFEWLRTKRPALVARYRELYERSNYVSRAFGDPILARVQEAKRAVGFGAADDADDEDELPSWGQMRLFE